jgi:hypothetical protein
LSQLPIPEGKNAAIAKLLAEGHKPGSNIKWEPFCDLVRNACDGWVVVGKKRKPKTGFTLRQIRRVVTGK